VEGKRGEEERITFFEEQFVTTTKMINADVFLSSHLTSRNLANSYTHAYSE
jgi:hypothetical protein